jgi:hypothetical protein
MRSPPVSIKTPAETVANGKDRRNCFRKQMRNGELVDSVTMTAEPQETRSTNPFQEFFMTRAGLSYHHASQILPAPDTG